MPRASWAGATCSVKAQREAVDAPSRAPAAQASQEVREGFGGAAGPFMWAQQVPEPGLLGPWGPMGQGGRSWGTQQAKGGVAAGLVPALGPECRAAFPGRVSGHMAQPHGPALHRGFLGLPSGGPTFS